MPNKSVYRGFVALFLILSLLPLLGMLLFGPSEAAANEQLQPKPTLTTRDGAFNWEFLSELGAYFGDHFALRQQAATGWAAVNAALFHSSVEDQILLGKEGWLFFRETLDDYRGQRLPDEQLQAIAQHLAQLQGTLEAQGKRFLFTVAPNKNSLYPAFMPDYIPNGHDESNLVRLRAFLEAEGVHYTDLYALLDGEEDILYFRTDSHWNSRGAALAADALLADAGKAGGYYEAGFSGTQAHEGDLYEMLYPRGALTEPDPVCSRALSYTCDTNPNGGNAITIRTHKDGETLRLFCWRDSFGISLYPYLADSFSSAVFSRSSIYDTTKEDVQNADVVILEIVERELASLLDDRYR